MIPLEHRNRYDKKDASVQVPSALDESVASTAHRPIRGGPFPFPNQRSWEVRGQPADHSRLQFLATPLSTFPRLLPAPEQSGACEDAHRDNTNARSIVNPSRRSVSRQFTPGTKIDLNCSLSLNVSLIKPGSDTPFLIAHRDNDWIAFVFIVEVQDCLVVPTLVGQCGRTDGNPHVLDQDRDIR